jgi:hypothetical protein
MNPKRHKTELLLFCLLALALWATAANGQSGRRQPKAPPSAPVPTPTPEPSPQATPKAKETDLNFLLAADRNSSYEIYPITYYDAVLHGCGDRLRSATSATVDISQNSVGRGEAIKKAKTSSNTRVVLIKLVLDDNARSYDDLEIDFVVFAPVTGKVLLSGRGYMNANRKGPIIVGPRTTPTGGAIYRERLLQNAGEDIAERILKWLNLNVPPVK